jgi:hypothetical protein
MSAIVLWELSLPGLSGRMEGTIFLNKFNYREKSG